MGVRGASSLAVPDGGSQKGPEANTRIAEGTRAAPAKRHERRQLAFGACLERHVNCPQHAPPHTRG